MAGRAKRKWNVWKLLKLGLISGYLTRCVLKHFEGWFHMIAMRNRNKMERLSGNNSSTTIAKL